MLPQFLIVIHNNKHMIVSHVIRMFHHLHQVHKQFRLWAILHPSQQFQTMESINTPTWSTFWSFEKCNIYNSIEISYYCLLRFIGCFDIILWLMVKCICNMVVVSFTLLLHTCHKGSQFPMSLYLPTSICIGMHTQLLILRPISKLVMLIITRMLHVCFPSRSTRSQA